MPSRTPSSRAAGSACRRCSICRSSTQSEFRVFKHKNLINPLGSPCFTALGTVPRSRTAGTRRSCPGSQWERASPAGCSFLSPVSRATCRRRSPSRRSANAPCSARGACTASRLLRVSPYDPFNASQRESFAAACTRSLGRLLPLPRWAARNFHFLAAS